MKPLKIGLWAAVALLGTLLTVAWVGLTEGWAVGACAALALYAYDDLRPVQGEREIARWARARGRVLARWRRAWAAETRARGRRERALLRGRRAAARAEARAARKRARALRPLETLLAQGKAVVAHLARLDETQHAVAEAAEAARRWALRLADEPHRDLLEALQRTTPPKSRETAEAYDRRVERSASLLTRRVRGPRP